MDDIILALDDVPAFALDVAIKLRTGDAVLLDGPMGAGKTTFARELLRALLQDETAEVPSPTFPICLTYEGCATPIWHYDLYRLQEGADLYALGWGEARRGGIAIVEWPQRAPQSQITPPYIRIRLSPTDDETKRRIERVFVA